MEDSIDWQAIEQVDAWLDRGVARQYKDQPLAQDWARLSKVIEELGEALEHVQGISPEDHARLSAISVSLGKSVSTLIGATGQNPRKGVTHSQDDVVNEVLDVVMTGLLCAQHMLKNSSTVRMRFRAKQERTYLRMLESERKIEPLPGLADPDSPVWEYLDGAEG